ncbi:MAG: transketolase [Betaproteobacteria bacterium]|nr:transketolase [Betaproteobacteria bacterium]
MSMTKSVRAPQTAFDPAASRRRCLKYRRRILDISQKVGALHAAPAFSCMEMTDVIYHCLMRRGNPQGFQDVFLMSKGHGCMTQYAILEDLGILPTEEMERYCTAEGILGAHPDRGNPGIEASTGSLGHGLGMAVGMAYAERLKRSGSNVYVVLSDGELQEGSSWEAAMMASNLHLDNLLAFLDLNDFSGLERMSETHTAFYPVREKFEAFGWEAALVNGHDAAAVYAAVAERRGGRPFALIGKTVKGRGVAFMENVPIWHYRSPNKEEYAIAIRDLAEIRA